MAFQESTGGHYYQMTELRASLHPAPVPTPGTNKIEPNPQILTRFWADVYAWAEKISITHPGHAIRVFETVETLRATIPPLNERKELAEYLCGVCKKEVTLRPNTDCPGCHRKRAAV